MKKDIKTQENKRISVEEITILIAKMREKIVSLNGLIDKARIEFNSQLIVLEKENLENQKIQTTEDLPAIIEEVISEEIVLNDREELVVEPVDEAKEEKPEEVIPEEVVTVYYPPGKDYSFGRQRKQSSTTEQVAKSDYKPRFTQPTAPSSSFVKPQPSKGLGRQANQNRKKTSYSDSDNESREVNLKARQKFEDFRNKDYSFDQEEEYVRVRTKKSGGRKKNEFNISETKVIEHAVIDKPLLSVKELSEKIGKTGIEIMKQLMALGIIKTINEIIDFETAELVASELGVTLELHAVKTSEEIMEEFHETEDDADENLKPRPPIVTIMGHVDHGKTSILDYIRKAHVASGEAGGITQHIGAYSVKNKSGIITFIDTPGHAAFTTMRERGANITDIVVIVVAADDGIMPQTIEAINHSKAAGVSIIIAINKVDKRDVDIERVLTQISEQGLVPEEWGGEIPCIRVSAKTGEGIETLLETISVTSEVMELKANPNRNGRGTILESRLDQRKGPIATVIVQNGTLRVGNFIVAGTVVGKIRAMQDERGKNVTKAGPSTAVAILGLKDVPNAGDNLLAVEDEKLTKQVAEERIAKEKMSLISGKSFTLDDFYKNYEEGQLKSMNIIIKGDVQGSVEALKSSLEELSNDEVKVNVISAVPGSINESDVVLAKTVGAVIIGFNVRPDSIAKSSADSKGVDIRLYRIIYDAIDDVQSAIKGMLKPVYREEYLGTAEVRAIYKIPGLGQIAGSMVKDGKIVRNANVRVIRNDIIIADTSISSLKRVKDDVKEVNTGYECGIGLKDFHDFKEGDLIESFKLVVK